MLEAPSPLHDCFMLQNINPFTLGVEMSGQNALLILFFFFFFSNQNALFISPKFSKQKSAKCIQKNKHKHDIGSVDIEIIFINFGFFFPLNLK